MEAEIQLSRLNEDKKIILAALEKELEILECMRKRKQLQRDNTVNDYAEVSYTGQ